ncbi:hypothetical protein NDU88_004690 [Pleurodeles waltl]|uniref:Uncharacterized protein n=1 Tax=Pleurodeles waltl TaxID=8319 RepID=A0AAV7QG99_PLEWA|nr:hypothetical protein NDU88_004690 [Pleurodeles waltl]
MGRLQGVAVIGRERDPGLDRRPGHGVRGPQHTLKLPVRTSPASRTLRARVVALGKQGETRPGALGHWAHGAWTMGIALGAWWWPTWSERCTPRGEVIGEGSGAPRRARPEGKGAPLPSTLKILPAAGDLGWSRRGLCNGSYGDSREQEVNAGRYTCPNQGVQPCPVTNAAGGMAGTQ